MSLPVPMLTGFLARRLVRTGIVSGSDEPTQENFDAAYEADIEAIVRRVLREEGR